MCRFPILFYQVWQNYCIYLSVAAPAYTNVRSEPQEEEVEKEKPFDERAYLAGRIPLVQGGPIDPSTFNG